MPEHTSPPLPEPDEPYEPPAVEDLDASDGPVAVAPGFATGGDASTAGE